MDIWVNGEIWFEEARVISGGERFNAARFGLCCFFGSIVAGELLYLLIFMSRYGRKTAFFNFLIAVLSCLIFQFITLAIAMWFAHLPWSENIPNAVDYAMGVGFFSSIWHPLALAEVTSYLHFITETGIATHDAQVIKKHIDKVFIASCIVTNIVRNALWVARMDDWTSMDWDSVWAFQHLYFGVEGMTLLNIGYTARLLNLAKNQNQKKADRAIRLFLLPVLVIHQVFVYTHYNISVHWGYNISWYRYRLGQATVQGLLEVFIATALIHSAKAIEQEQGPLVDVEMLTSRRENVVV